MLTGRIDRIANNIVSGWAYNSADASEHLIIRAECSGTVIGSVEANGHRPDLKGAGIGEGDHAFSLPLPNNTDILELSVVAVSSAGAEIGLSSLKERELDIRVRTLGLDVQKLRNQVDGVLPRVLGGNDDVENRFSSIEARLDASEVFLMRIDEMMRKIIEADKKKRKRWLGIF